jgi:hypothetical protein
MSVSGAGPEVAVNCVDSLVAVTAFQVHVAPEIRQLNGTVAGVEIHASLARHVDLDIDLVAAKLDGEYMVREAQLDLHRVATLMLDDSQAVVAELVAVAGDVDVDRVLVPSVDAEVGVGSIHPQVGLARDGVSLRPIVSEGQWAEGQNQAQ